MSETILNVEIKTGFQSSGELQSACQQSEKAAFLINSLFKIIELSTFGIQSTGTENLDDYLEHIRHLSEIGQGLSMSIFGSIQPFEAMTGDKETH